MIVAIHEREGPAASKVVQLSWSTQDVLDVALLETLFHSAPAYIKATINAERHADFASATLYWTWPKEGE